MMPKTTREAQGSSGEKRLPATVLPAATRAPASDRGTEDRGTGSHRWNQPKKNPPRNTGSHRGTAKEEPAKEEPAKEEPASGTGQGGAGAKEQPPARRSAGDSAKNPPRQPDGGGASLSTAGEWQLTQRPSQRETLEATAFRVFDRALDRRMMRIGQQKCVAMSGGGAALSVLHRFDKPLIVAACRVPVRASG